MESVPLPIVFLNSHPIQYFTPLYQFCTKNGLDIEVWYCSNESVLGKKDKGFGVNVRWDIPLLEGYKHKFFKNYSWKPSIHGGFYGLINLGLAAAVFKRGKSILIIHGWNFFSSIYLIVIGRIAGHKICIRAESPLNQELKIGSWRRSVKKLVLGKFLFRFVYKFLYIGTQNKHFYEYYGVKPNKLLFVPYAVDNERFQTEARLLSSNRNDYKKLAGIPDNAVTIVYSGKYISKKRPLILLEAYKKISLNNNVSLVMVGEGDMRPEMEKYINEHDLKNVILTGFVNQSQISKWYSMADIFVMCSGDGETWGLSINEAMNFSIPIVVSDRVGCAVDLVKPDFNGYTFAVDNVEELAAKLDDLVRSPRERLIAMGLGSRELVDKYSYKHAWSILCLLSNEQDPKRRK